MIAALDDAAVIQPHNDVRVLDGGQAVCDDEHRASLHQLIHSSLDDRFGAGVDRRGCLVEDHHGRVGVRRAGDRHHLPLSLREVRAVVGERGIVPLRQTGDEIVRADELRRLDALLVARVELTVADVIHHRAGKQVGVLQHDAQRAAQVSLFDLIDINAVVPHLTVRDVVKAVDEVGDGGLARARRADKGDLLPRFGVNGDVAQDGLAFLVGEVHFGEPHVTRERGVGEGAVAVRVLPRPASRALFCLGDGAVRGNRGVDQRYIAVVHLRRLIHQREDALRTRERHRDGVDLLGELVDVSGELLGHIEKRHDDVDGEG